VPFVPAPGVARVELIYLQHSQTVENVYHVKVAAGGPLTEAQLDALKVVFQAWWENNLRAQTPLSAVLQRYEVRDMTAQDALAKIYPCTANCIGGSGANALPGNVTVAVKWGTGFAGRSRRGRTYHIGLWSAAITGNALTATAQTNIQAAYANLITRLTTAATPLVIYSRMSAGVYRSSALITEVTSATVDPNTDSQRRRLTGPGRGD